MMNLTGFCRNCLSRWYQEAANERGIDDGQGRRARSVYRMPYDDWRAANQTPADAEKQAAFAKAFTENTGEPSKAINPIPPQTACIVSRLWAN